MGIQLTPPFFYSSLTSGGHMPRKPDVNWVHCPKVGGHETIYKNQYFWKKMYGAYFLSTLGAGMERELHWRKRRKYYIGTFSAHRCHFCNLSLDDAVLRYTPTPETKTRYTNWERCTMGFCKRLTLLINGKRYWAKFNLKTGKFDIFNLHLGRTPIGSLPVRFVPVELRSQLTPVPKKRSRVVTVGWSNFIEKKYGR